MQKSDLYEVRTINQAPKSILKNTGNGMRTSVQQSGYEPTRNSNVTQSQMLSQLGQYVATGARSTVGSVRQPPQAQRQTVPAQRQTMPAGSSQVLNNLGNFMTRTIIDFFMPNRKYEHQYNWRSDQTGAGE
jgi:hypothetical protein